MTGRHPSTNEENEAAEVTLNSEGITRIRRALKRKSSELFAGRASDVDRNPEAWDGATWPIRDVNVF